MKRTTFDPQIVDWLMPELIGKRKSPAAFIVYLFLWRMAFQNNWIAYVSYQKIADQTGLSKSAVQAAIRYLNQARLIRTVRETTTATPEHHVLRPWASRR